MDVNPNDQEKSHFCSTMESKKLPNDCPCFETDRPISDEANQPYSMDVFPVLVEETSIPMELSCPFDSSNGQDIYSFSFLPEEHKMNPHCASELTVLSLLEVDGPCKTQICVDAHLGYEDCFDFQLKSTDADYPCPVDIDLENGNGETQKCTDQNLRSMNTEGLLANMQKVLRRQISLKTGERLVELLMNHGTILLSKERSVTERAHDSSNNRWRKYRRAASFDSRKVVLLFSILSSLGTLVLIYLTLKVRQNGEASQDDGEKVF